jgi:hypothetical protein
MPPRVEPVVVPPGKRMPTYAELSVILNKLVTERDGEWASRGSTNCQP